MKSLLILPDLSLTINLVVHPFQTFSNETLLNGILVLTDLSGFSNNTFF